VKLTVCIPTVRPTRLSYAVQSIIAQTWPDWELLIVGQGADPELERACQSLRQLDRRIRYLHLERKGISRARNAGLLAATGDIIAFTDDDCEAAPDWLETLATLFAQHPQVGMIGGALVAPPVSRWKLESCISLTPPELLYDPASGEQAPPGWSWVGANFAIRKAIVEQVGLFDEWLGVGASRFAAAEDVDYNMRVLAAGVSVLCTPTAVVRHTYGARRGVKQYLRMTWAYARGNAGLDGKLTLAGNPHGPASAAQHRLRPSVVASLRRGKLYKLPIEIAEALVYSAAYRECLRDFAIGADGGLQLLNAASSDSYSLAQTRVG
jgi:glycosyltransferase involved in cell wall biosynthesis